MSKKFPGEISAKISVGLFRNLINSSGPVCVKFLQFHFRNEGLVLSANPSGIECFQASVPIECLPEYFISKPQVYDINIYSLENFVEMLSDTNHENEIEIKKADLSGIIEFRMEEYCFVCSIEWVDYHSEFIVSKWDNEPSIAIDPTKVSPVINAIYLFDGLLCFILNKSNENGSKLRVNNGTEKLREELRVHDWEANPFIEAELFCIENEKEKNSDTQETWISRTFSSINDAMKILKDRTNSISVYVSSYHLNIFWTEENNVSIVYQFSGLV